MTSVQVSSSVISNSHNKIQLNLSHIHARLMIDNHMNKPLKNWRPFTPQPQYTNLLLVFHTVQNSTLPGVRSARD